jgi:outer membrane biosynthesis protein TonB
MKIPIKFWHILLSLTGHLVILLGLFHVGKQDVINKKFLVLGAHSQKTYETLFKNFKIPRSGPTQNKTRTQVTKKQVSKKSPIKKKLVKKTISRPKKKNVIIKKKNPVPIKIKKKVHIAKKVTKSPAKKPTPPVKKIVTAPQKKTPIKQKHENLRFNLTGNSDSAMLEYQLHIQREITRLWQPPIGAPKGTECSVKFVINKLGKVERFKMLKRSEMLIYDLSVLRVAKRFKFHASLWDKNFIIDFRQ